MINNDAIMLHKTTQLTSQEKKESTEKKRLEKWRERQATEQPSFSYQAQLDGKINGMHPKFNDPNITQLQIVETVRANLCAATGTASQKYGSLILSQTVSAFFKDEYYDSTFVANATHEALLAMNPADEYEGMLCSRLLVLHDQYMNFMNRTTNIEISEQAVDLNINRATKLMRLYNETLETLNRYRRKGEQKVTVQHVNVSNGGQAVVTGSMNGSGG